MLDAGEADDKIVAVLEKDASYGHFRDIKECPNALVQRLIHYFLTYKMSPQGESPSTEVTEVYGREEAHEVIRRRLRTTPIISDRSQTCSKPRCILRAISIKVFTPHRSDGPESRRDDRT